MRPPNRQFKCCEMKLLLMFVLMCDITIGNYRFRQCHEVKIEKTWRELGSRCTIKLPKHIRTDAFTTSTLESVIKPGDAVTVKLKYLGLAEKVEFEGTVARIKPNIPFEVECEDAVYLFKRTPIKKTWAKEEKPTLRTVVAYVVDQVNAKYPLAHVRLSSDLPSVSFSEKGFVIEAGNNAATVLEKLKEEYGLASYFKGPELFTGLLYQKTYGRVRHSLAWNVIDSDLTYRTEDDTQIRIKAIGFKPDNTKVETKKIVGDADGELRTIHYYNVSNESELLKLAENDLKKYKINGFEGKFTTFLYPYAEPLMITDLTDPRYDQSRTGSYIIDSVVTTFGPGGARREIEPGIKTSANG